MLLNFFEKIINPFKDQPDVMPPQSILPFYWHYLRQIKYVFIALLIVGFFVALLEVMLFGFLGRIVDLVQQTPSPQALFSLHKNELLTMFVIIVLVRPLCSVVHDLLTNQTLTTNLTSLIRWQHHRYVLKQSVNFFHSDFSGSVANRILNTSQSIRNSTLQVIDALWRVVIYLGATIVIFIGLDWRLTLPLIIWVISYIAVLYYFLPKTKERSHISARARSKLMGIIVDGYTNIITLKLFSYGDREARYALAAMKHQTRMALNSTRLITGMNISLTLINSLLIAGTIGLSLWLWSAALITPGAIALAISLIIRINTMSSWVMRVVSHIFEDIGSVQDGMRIIAKERTVQDVPLAKPLVVTQGTIEFKCINFSYNKQRMIYEQLNLAINAKEKIGLVGPSGAGKSTLVNLLLRLYDLNSGEILIDGQDIAQVQQDCLRSQIGMVTQDTTLLHRSIRDNLLYGKPDATEAELLQALKQTKADQFVFNLVDHSNARGLEATVGERGVKLSGGQRQRIAIARVLLKNAPILILDEATSALDSEIEVAIQENLEQLMTNKTVIAIAHRLSTIAQMDRLIVMDHGQIIEMGSHHELLQKNGLYARLWRHQTGNFINL